MATLRNLAIGLLRLAGHTQITPTLRWVNRNPARALAFLSLPMNPLTPNPITPRPWTPRERGSPSATNVTRWASCSIFESTRWPKHAAP
jgi:hypothetical protein